MIRIKLFVFALVAVLAPAGAARAAEMSHRVAIGAFKGPQAGRLQDAVETALLRRYFLVPGSEVSEAARKSGVRLRNASEFAEVARRLNVQAFVTATVKKERDWKVEMVVRKGDTGETVGRYDWSDRRLRGLALVMARATPRRLRALLAGSGAPAAEEKADEELEAKAPALPDGPDEEEETAATTTPVRPYLELGVGGKIFNRSMSYADNYSRLPGYSLGRATAVTLDLAFHPFALGASTRDTWMAGLGLTGAFSYALDIGTELAGDRRASSSVHGYELGLRQRISVGALDVIPHAGYLVDTFLSNGSDLAPDVRYQAARAGVGARLGLGARFSVRASADYLHVLSAGPLNDDGHFPRATAQGMDLSGGAGYALTDAFEAGVTVAWRRYGWDMKVAPGDALIAGGAIDQYLSVTVGLAYRPTLGRN
jgi:hypothetical protein